tara:strand:+ start:2738 stop:3013 length:276 start_codon:yes stop_codon:yes gene_type:complete
MGKVTDINKFKRPEEVSIPLPIGEYPETDGNYMSIVVGEDRDGQDIILIEQCEVEGTTEHKDTIIVDVEMLQVLITELIVVARTLESKEPK